MTSRLFLLDLFLPLTPLCLCPKSFAMFLLLVSTPAWPLGLRTYEEMGRHGKEWRHRRSDGGRFKKLTNVTRLANHVDKPLNIDVDPNNISRSPSPFQSFSQLFTCAKLSQIFYRIISVGAGRSLFRTSKSR